MRDVGRELAPRRLTRGQAGSRSGPLPLNGSIHGARRGEYPCFAVGYVPKSIPVFAVARSLSHPIFEVSRG